MTNNKGFIDIKGYYAKKNNPSYQEKSGVIIQIAKADSAPRNKFIKKGLQEPNKKPRANRNEPYICKD